MEGRQLTLFDFEEHDRQERERNRSRAEILEDYEGFTEKFKPKKTTDDCYTPEPVYAAVLDFVRTLPGTEGRAVCRPFWPGRDYTQYPYPENCIVIDNPPFSIYAQIVRWYLSRGIDFFLFGPQLTLFVRNADVTYLVTNAQITYENGAVVNTSFITNLTPGIRIWLNPRLRAAIEAVAPPPKLMAKNTYPDELVTSATLGKIIARNVELIVPSDECEYIANLDGLARAGKSLYGGGVSTIQESGSGESGSGGAHGDGGRAVGRRARHCRQAVQGERVTRPDTEVRTLHPHKVDIFCNMKFAFVNTFDDLCFRLHISNYSEATVVLRQTQSLCEPFRAAIYCSRAVYVGSAKGLLFLFLLCLHRTKPASHCHKTSRTSSPRLSCPPSPTFKSPGRCTTSSQSSCSTSPVPCRAGSATGSRSCWVKSRTSTTSAARCSSTSSPRPSRAFLSVNPCCYDHR